MSWLPNLDNPRTNRNVLLALCLAAVALIGSCLTLLRDKVDEPLEQIERNQP